MSKEVRSLPDDPGKLKRLLWRERQQHQQLVDQHQRTLAQHQEVVRQYEETVQGQQTTISQQEHRIAQLLRRLYGPKQERIDPNQLTLFDGDDLEALTAESPEEAPGEEEKARKQRRGRGVGHGRRRLPKHLPRETVLHELSEEARRCPCCGELREEIGRETSEQLEYVPAQVKVLVHQRVKYACRRCQEQVVIAAKPPQPIAKGLPGPGLLAQTVLGKYGDHLPLYRLEDILARQGVTIRRSTLCGWIAAAADLGEPLYRRMCQRVLQSKVLHTDDTAVKLLDPLLGRAREARFWAYIGDRRHPYAVYDFTPHHQRDGPAKFLGGFEGYLQADAYGGYDGIFLDSGGKIVEVACWAHCRRYWWEAKTTDSPRAHQALSYIARLYQLEKQFADQTAQQRGRLRREHARPVLEEFRSWLDGEGVRGVLPKSATGKALTYTRNQWEALGRYTEDGELAIDNNLAERTVKIPALGRKNWRAPDVLSRTSGRLEGSGCLVGNVQRTAAVWSAVCI
jgi:transposase